MNKQPEALRLAKALEQGKYLLSVERDATAAELRRLHAENEALQNTKHYEAPPGFVLNPDYLVPELRAQRDALLEALAVVLLEAEHTLLEPTRRKARAAIKAVEEGK